MAQNWPAKAPSEIVERRWTVPLDDYDTISSIATSATGVTVVETAHALEDAIIVLSAGSAGTTATVAVTVTSREGRVYTETFLLAIRAPARQFTTTARDVIDFALRKIVGNGATADAAEADDALERLNDMIAEWRIDGTDIGVPAPLALGAVLAIPDEYISALKFNLRLDLHDFYGSPLTAREIERADTSKRNLVNKLTSFSDLAGPFGLSTTTDTAADLF